MQQKSFAFLLLRRLFRSIGQYVTHRLWSYQYITYFSRFHRDAGADSHGLWDAEPLPQTPGELWLVDTRSRDQLASSDWSARGRWGRQLELRLQCRHLQQPVPRGGGGQQVAAPLHELRPHRDGRDGLLHRYIKLNRYFKNNIWGCWIIFDICARREVSWLRPGAAREKEEAQGKDQVVQEALRQETRARPQAAVPPPPAAPGQLQIFFNRVKYFWYISNTRPVGFGIIQVLGSRNICWNMMNNTK